MEGRSGTGRLGTKYYYYVCRRRDCGLRGIAEVAGALSRLDQEQVTAEMVRAGLERFRDLLEVLTPFERKELVRLVPHRADLADRRIALEIYPITPQELAMPQSRSRSEAPNWLPIVDAVRTMCISPTPESRVALERARELVLA